MLSILFVTCGLLSFPGSDQPAAKADLSAYEAAKAKVGSDAAAHVKLALWCEAHGLTAERIKHLALATLGDPTNAAARGLLGLVLYQGKWQRPDDVSRQAREDPARQATLKEYLDRRVRAADKPDDQWKLALWCDQNGLKEQTTIHLRRVIALDPKREAAWKRLGFKKQGSQWVKPDLAVAEKAEHEAQHRADVFWKPKLEHLRDALGGRDKARRATAGAALGQITDPRAVPMVWAVFVRGDHTHQRVAVQILGQIDASGSSRALALLGVFSPWADVRNPAAAILRRRDPRDFAELLVSLIRDPIKYKVKQVNGPGSQGELLVEGKEANVMRLYTPLPPPMLMPGFRLGMDASGMLVASRVFDSYTAGFSGPMSFQKASSTRLGGILQQAGFSLAQSKQLGQTMAANANGFPLPNLQNRPVSMSITTNVQDSVAIPIGQMMADAQNSAVAAQQQLNQDVQSIEASNAQAAVTNDRVRNILKEFSGQDLGPNQQAWANWAVDLKGYAVQPSLSAQSPPPTFVEQVPLDYQPQAGPPVFTETSTAQVQVRVSHSCFGAGTQVRTLDGPRAIEDIRDGEPVLTQNTTTGALSYRPVVVAYHNPPNATFRIDLGHEAIVATGIHRFWKAGQGWIMARELKPGDRLRTIGGIAQVKAVERDNVQPVFNLQIAEGDNFFVGAEGVLAHDNSIVNPTEKPFDGVPVLGELPAPSGQ